MTRDPHGNACICTCFQVFMRSTSHRKYIYYTPMGMRFLGRWDYNLISMNRTHRTYFYFCITDNIEYILDEAPRKNMEKNPAMILYYTHACIFPCHAHAWNDRSLLDQYDDALYHRKNPRMEKNRSGTEASLKNPSIVIRESHIFRRMFSDFLWIFFYYHLTGAR